MTVYTNFIGVDIGKFSFVVSVYGVKAIKEYDNDAVGIKSFIKDYRPYLSKGLCVLETTGGYEMRLVLSLCEAGYSVHRANARKVKHFIRSLGISAKTDKLDSKALALYGYERGARLDCFTPQSSHALALYELVQRRQDLKRLLVAEKNRLKAPRADLVQASCQVMIETITHQIGLISEQINAFIEQDPALKAKKEILKSIPGIGEITANELLVLLPELGTLSRRQIASLAGVAPIANDSGAFKGYRATRYGRADIKPILFLSAMAARNSKSRLKTFYNRLIESGKKKMVALTALMRKIIVIANARLKEFNSAPV
ncbi:IS110 family RNA-guided transposase [Methylophaga thalassica]|uniref:IS110 family transposase n=1 Tax=Methylophaga aminisulfidivorans TaxID=230105 RepID=UPI0024E25E53|nr:IS110 family transposase [Methylophaga aminisulfidivorans]